MVEIETDGLFWVERWIDGANTSIAQHLLCGELTAQREDWSSLRGIREVVDQVSSDRDEELRSTAAGRSHRSRKRRKLAATRPSVGVPNDRLTVDTA